MKMCKHVFRVERSWVCDLLCLEGRDLFWGERQYSSELTKWGKETFRPMVKYVANIHGDEAVTRELLLALAQHLVWNYGTSQRVTQLLNKTEVRFKMQIGEHLRKYQMIHQRPPSPPLSVSLFCRCTWCQRWTPTGLRWCHQVAGAGFRSMRTSTLSTSNCEFWPCQQLVRLKWWLLLPLWNILCTSEISPPGVTLVRARSSCWRSASRRLFFFKTNIF